MSKFSDVAVRRCSSKQVFLKISQYSQKSTCVGVFFFHKPLPVAASEFLIKHFILTGMCIPARIHMSKKSLPEVLCKNGFLFKNETPAQLLSCEFHKKTSKSTFLQNATKRLLCVRNKFMIYEIVRLLPLRLKGCQFKFTNFLYALKI